MKVVIAGGHGQIALVLQRLLADAGHEPVGIIRNPDQAPDLEQVGGHALVLDLEHTDAETLAAELDGADAVLFAAGGGPNSGAARAAADAAACHAGSDRGQGLSTQLIAVSASMRLE